MADNSGPNSVPQPYTGVAQPSSGESQPMNSDQLSGGVASQDPKRGQQPLGIELQPKSKKQSTPLTKKEVIPLGVYLGML
jgi:hypothetical protein